jgi:HSP20 family protein
MALIPFKPFRDLERWIEEWEGFLPEISLEPRFRPSMDIYETDKEVVAEVEVAGIDPKKIKVSIENNVLTVEGGEEKKEEEKKKGYFRREIRKGYFKRAVVLPAGIEADKAKAQYEDGILKVIIPKIAPAKKEKAKEIAIKIKK